MVRRSLCGRWGRVRADRQRAARVHRPGAQRQLLAQRPAERGDRPHGQPGLEADPELPDDLAERVVVAVDCANGAAHAIGPHLLRSLGAEVAVLHADEDAVLGR